MTVISGDTIAAVATAPGPGGVAIVRISGDGAFSIARRLTGREVEAGRARLVDVKVDRPLMLAFAAPRSYTGEDTVEFHCHGGTVTPRRVMELAFAAGARLARRGEFTQRAYLNGKISYEEAEGVLALVNAKTDRAADAALEQLNQKGDGEKRRLYGMALDLSAEVEHSLDVDESELDSGFFPRARQRSEAILQAAERELKRMREGMILRNGAMVVLSGAPNAGKSSLMNALLGMSRAIVSDVAGTTRDSIEEWLDIGGFPVRLVDTAGLRETEDEVEAEGVARSRRLMAEAAIVLRLEPGGSGEERPGEILVASKSDLVRGSGIAVSAVTGEGLDDLRRAIVSRLELLSETPVEDASDAAEDGYRQVARLARECIGHAESGEAVLLGNSARALSERLGGMVGAVYSEDLLDRLFSRFCVGK